MKHIKIVLTISLVLCCLLFCSFAANAADKTPVLARTSFDVVQGETFTSTIYIEKGSNVSAMTAYLTYDPDLVTLISCETNEDAIIDTTINTQTVGHINLSFASSKNMSAELKLVDVTFKVNDYLADGSYDLLTISESDSYFRRLNSNNIAENIAFSTNLQKLNIYKYGDINLDGVVDGSDAVYILRYAAGLSSGAEGTEFFLPYYVDTAKYTPHQLFMLKIGDAFPDQEITGQDSVSVLRYAAGFSTEIMGSRVDIRFIDGDGNLFKRMSAIYGSELKEVPELPAMEGYTDGTWNIIDSKGSYVAADFKNMSANISVYAVYGGYLSGAMQYYKDLLTTMYYSGDLKTGLSSDQSLTNSLTYQDDYTAKVVWSSSNNAVLNATTGKFSKPTYESTLTLTANITSYKDVKIESTDSISFSYNVKGFFITPTKASIAQWLSHYFEYGIDYDLKLPTLIDNERVGSENDYEVRVSWEVVPELGEAEPISVIHRSTSAKNIDLIATITYNGMPLEDDGKVYFDNVSVSAITKDEVRASVINQIAAHVGLTVTTNTELWTDEQVYGTHITWTSNNTSVATIANNIISISDDAINGTNLPVTAHVNYVCDGKPLDFNLSYTISIANNNTLLVRGTNIDADLYDALKSQGGFSGNLTTESLKSPKFVYLDLRDYPDITSLRGLTYCANLRVLNISGLKITDGINEIATLTKLQAFIARGCELHNLSDGGVPVLKNMADLRLIDLSNNNFENLDSVLASGIKYGKLNEVYLANNKLTDISGLNRAPALNVLVLSSNGLESNDVTQIASFKFLRYLSLANNKITDISMLSGLKYLGELRLQRNNITNIKPLAGLVYLEALYLGHNNVNVDVGFLNTLAKLKVLYLNDNSIDSISQLTMLSALESINVSNNNIDSLSVLENYSDTLTEVYAENNELTSIDFVADMTKLNVLMLSGNSVFATNSSDLSGLTKLKILTLSGIPLNDLSFLNNYESLIWLDVSNCGLKSYTIRSKTLCTDETTGTSYYQVTNYIDNVSAIASQKKTLYYLDVSDNDFSVDTNGLSFSNGTPSGFNSLNILSKLIVLYADNINYTIEPYTLFAMMSQIQYVSIENCGITDMSWLSGLRYLIYVDLANNSINEVNLGSSISMYSKGSLKYLYLDTDAESCTFKNAYYTFNDNSLRELSLKGCGVSDMSLLPDMPDIKYLNIADNTMTNLDGLVPISHSVTRYSTLEEIDVSGLDLDVSPLADISSLQTVYAVAKPSDTLFHKTDITALYGMYKNGVKWYLYDKATKLNPTSSVEGAKILNEIKDFSCSITVAADNVISDNNPFIVDKVNDYDITWSLSNSKNYEIVNNHLSVKDYSDIEDEKLTVTATITVYPDQSTVSRDFTINTHILRVSNANTNYYTFNTTGMDDNLTRTSDFTYDIALKSADTTGFTGKVKPVETEIRYSIKSVLKDGKTVVPSSNVITDKGNHSYTVTSAAPFDSVTTFTVDIGHTVNGEFIIDDTRTRSFTVKSRTFTVTYVLNNGTMTSTSDNSSISQQNIPEDDLMFQNVTYSRTGYLFAGWYNDAQFTSLFWSGTGTAPTMPAKNFTLYAKWTAHSFTLTYNANGGDAVSPASKTVLCDQPYGTLPTPTRTGYTFNGWYTKASGGEVVTASTTSSDATNKTIYAHWTVNAYTAKWNTGTGYTINVKRTSSPNKGAATGDISSGATVYYGDVLSITYTASTGYSISTKGATSITVTGNVTSSNIYATVSVLSYTASWSTGTGYSISVKRTSSPKAEAATGAISSGAKVYYGDVLTITYTKADYYHITGNGKTSITVTGNVTSSDIYATAALNDEQGPVTSIPSGGKQTRTATQYRYRNGTWGGWSGWSTSAVSSSSTRQVETRSVATTCLTRWKVSNGGYVDSLARAKKYSSYSAENYWVATSSVYSYDPYNTGGHYWSTELWSDSGEYPLVKNGTSSRTEYRYRDLSWGSWSSWSLTSVSSSQTRQVKTRTVYYYRAK